MHVLSTKTLEEHQKKILENTGINLSCYDAIQIKEIDFILPEKLTHCIFTSQNSVRLFMKKVSCKDISNIQAYCVGVKTAKALKSHGIAVVKQTDYAAELVRYLKKNHVEKQFDFFCGKLRHDTIPKGLAQNDILFKETILYDTLITPKQYSIDFSAVLFYSPSGVRSFFNCNTFNSKTVAVCIGTTTASEARKFTDNIKISDTPTIESVLWKTIELIKQ